MGIIGVLINYMWPSRAFEITMNVAGIGIAGTWISIMVSHWAFVRRPKLGLVERPQYRHRGAPYINIATILFLLAVTGGMWFADDIGQPTILLFLGICAILALNWLRVRSRVRKTAGDPYETAL